MESMSPAFSSTIRFGVVLLVVMTAGIGVIRDLVAFSLANATASHVILVPFVTIALVLRERAAIFTSIRPASRLGAAVIALGIGVALWGRFRVGDLAPQDHLSLSVAGMVMAVLGGFLLAYGTRAFRASVFPWLFLAFTVPFPTVIVDGITNVLKSGSTEAVAGLFSLTGTPYFREGFVFSLPTTSIEIADECSGIRSSIGLFLTMMLAGHVYFDGTFAKSIVLLAIIPITILKNGIRIVTLTLLAVQVDPGFLTGQLHHEGGIVFFILALAMQAPLVFWLRRRELRRQRPDAPGFLEWGY
jgi:exosortase